MGFENAFLCAISLASLAFNLPFWVPDAARDVRSR